VPSKAVAATPINAKWIYKISVTKGAPTPDVASKAIAMAGSLFGTVTVAEGVDAGALDDVGFSLRSNIKVAALLSMLDNNLNMYRQSTGVFTSGFVHTQRYVDKRGSAAELQVVANFKSKLLTFTQGSNPARTEAIKYPTTDIAMLPYAFIGHAAPKAAVTVAFTDGKSLYTTTLSPQPEGFEVAGQQIRAVRLSGNAARGRLELWVREADSYPLHMRIGLGAQYGAVLEQDIDRVPAALVVVNDVTPLPPKPTPAAKPAGSPKRKSP